MGPHKYRSQIGLNHASARKRQSGCSERSSGGSRPPIDKKKTTFAPTSGPRRGAKFEIDFTHLWAELTRVVTANSESRYHRRGQSHLYSPCHGLNWSRRKFERNRPITSERVQKLPAMYSKRKIPTPISTALSLHLLRIFSYSHISTRSTSNPHVTLLPPPFNQYLQQPSFHVR